MHRAAAWVGEEGPAKCLYLLNVNDAHHLEYLMWAIYDGALLVGERPKLPGNCPWCTVLAGLYRHIYKAMRMAHCLPYMLAYWDCQERVEALCQEGRIDCMEWTSAKIQVQEWFSTLLLDTCPGGLEWTLLWLIT